jgi:hypothetical protein
MACHGMSICSFLVKNAEMCTQFYKAAISVNWHCLQFCRVCGQGAKLTCGYCKTWRYCSPECRNMGCTHYSGSVSEAGTSPGALCFAARIARLVISGRDVGGISKTLMHSTSSRKGSHSSSASIPPLHILLPCSSSGKVHVAPLLEKARISGNTYLPQPKDTIPYQMLPSLATALVRAVPLECRSVALQRIKHHLMAEVIRREVDAFLAHCTILKNAMACPQGADSCIADVNTDLLETMLCASVARQCRLCGRPDVEGSCQACQSVAWCAEHAEVVQAAHGLHACLTTKQYQLLHRYALVPACINDPTLQYL